MKTQLLFGFVLFFNLAFCHFTTFLGKQSSLTKEELQHRKFPVITNQIGKVIAFKISAYPPSIDDGEDVVVSWSHVPNPSIFDFVSISCGPTNGLNDYLDKQNISQNSAKAGSGSLRFSNLVMMRCNYVFIYLNCIGPNSCQALGSVIVTMRSGLHVPHQGHISFTSNFDEMGVTFVTSSNFSVPMVKYGTDPNNLNMLSYGTSITYKASDLCNSPANVTAQMWFRDPGFIHSVTLKNLKYSTVYYYQYGTLESGWSTVRSFLSHAPPNGVIDFPVTKFLAYADMGNSNAGVLTALRSNVEITQGFNNFLLHFGDISYALGGAWVWDSYFHLIESYATKIPYMASVGNHEYDHIAGGEHDPSHAPGVGWHPSWGNMGDDSNGECAVPTYHRFVTPQNGNSIFWYSFDYGAVHVIQMSSEHDWTKGSEQYKWIEKDLASVDRKKTPWIILTSHRMMYTTQLLEDDDYVVSEHFKIEMDDLINDYGVNLMLTGHQHSYERSCPVYKRECVSDGQATVHIIVGTAGAGLEEGGFSNKFGNWSLVHVKKWGYCRLTADTDTLFVEFVDNETGTVFDEVTLLPWFGNKMKKTKMTN